MWDKIKHSLERSSNLALYVFALVLICFFIVMPILYAISLYTQNEASNALKSLYIAEKERVNESQKWTDNFNELAWSPPEGDLKYSYFLTTESWCGKDPYDLYIDLPLNYKGFGVPEPGATGTGFVAVAIGDVDCDDDLDVWWIDQTGELHNEDNDTNFMRVLVDCMGLFFYNILDAQSDNE